MPVSQEDDRGGAEASCRGRPVHPRWLGRRGAEGGHLLSCTTPVPFGVVPASPGSRLLSASCFSDLLPGVSSLPYCSQSKAASVEARCRPAEAEAQQGLRAARSLPAASGVRGEAGFQAGALLVPIYLFT